MRPPQDGAAIMEEKAWTGQCLLWDLGKALLLWADSAFTTREVGRGSV